MVKHKISIITKYVRGVTLIYKYFKKFIINNSK